MKRITLFAGHYGSGKTNLAVNYALRLRRDFPRVVIADLDIVNPYFRTLDSAAELKAAGVEVVVSKYANSNVDFPALPKEAYALMAAGGGGEAPRVVIDVGGDDRGALALGRYVPEIVAEGDYELLGVVNACRPLTATAADAVATLREIAAAARLDFTGIVNNTNLGPATTAATVLSSGAYAEEVARALGVEVRFTACDARLADELVGRVPGLFPLALQRLYYHFADGVNMV